MAKKREIRNSTAEFLIFQIEGKEQGIEVYYKDKTVWCTQKAMGMLFDCTPDNIGVHLQNIYDTHELNKEATTEKISVVQDEGGRQVKRNVTFYNLDAIISVGYRVNSRQAKVSAKQAKEKAESEYDIFNKTQKITSDFDREVQKMIEGNKGNA
jgi:hypothetical protein